MGINPEQGRKRLNWSVAYACPRFQSEPTPKGFNYVLGSMHLHCHPRRHLQITALQQGCYELDSYTNCFCRLNYEKSTILCTSLSWNIQTVNVDQYSGGDSEDEEEV